MREWKVTLSGETLQIRLDTERDHQDPLNPQQNVRPNGRIFALEFKTGKKLWVYKTKATLGPAAYADKTVFVGDSESRLYALDEVTGQERWKFKSSGGAIHQPAVKNGVVYFSTHDGSLHAVDAQSGLERWKSKEPKVATALALDEINIYFGGEDFNLYALDITNGKIRWVYKTKKECHSPVLAGGIVCFTTGDSMLALGATTGAEKWKVTELGKVVSAPIFEPDAVYFLDGEGHLYALK
jgi:outer membrane protein assembly factor BamB